MDPETLRRAFQRLVDRHAALRTTFPAIEGEPWQVVHDHVNVAFHVEDATSWSDAKLDSRIAEETYTAFDLERDPPFRVTLLRQPHGESILLLALHHIVTDMWSLAILLSEVPKFYQAEFTGVRADLKPLRIEYTDHVSAQLEMLEGPEAERHWEFWQSQLSGDLPVLELPTDRPRHGTPTDQGTAETFSVSAEVTEHLLGLARAHHTTLEAVILAAFQVLLHRYTGQEDILVGSTRAGRTAKSARTFGYFVNPIVMRGDLSGNPTFSDFLSALGATANAAGEHDDYPLAKVVERLQPQRNTRWSSIFQVMFTWRKTTKLVDPNSMAGVAIGVAGTSMAPEGIQLEVLPVRHRCTFFDLILLVAEAEGALLGTFEYRTDLFEAATIQRMIGHFQTLLHGIVTDPHQRISRLPLLTEREKHQLLVEWNDTAQPFPEDQCVHQLFEAQVARTPDAVAVAMDAVWLTYRDLEHRANRLANTLRRQEVGPESLVGIAMERSPEMIVAVLAVLKAGAAYVPLDPRYPLERLATMVQDAQVSVLITQEALLNRLPQSTARLICLDASGGPALKHSYDDYLQESSAPPATAVSADNLAYVIYTSGSTGEAQGRHAGASRPVQSGYRSNSGLRRGSGQPSAAICISQLRRLRVGDLYGIAERSNPGAGRAGGAGIAARPTSPAAQPGHYHRHPASFHAAGAARRRFARPADLGLRRGELPLDVAERWKRGRRFFNAYGPTEATIGSTCYLVEDLPESAATVPIGRPVANTQVYLLDDHLQPVPLGVHGELYIGGVGVARGYLNKPELTADKFILDTPPSHALVRTNGKGKRLYRTGDRCRYLPDGNIEFLGRRDNQVKVRGFRVELEEIEAVLRRHPAVQEVTADIRAGARKRDDMRLVAYVVLLPGKSVTLTDLRGFVGNQLPDYMTPSTFVLLDELPLTPAGKVDRHALPEVEQAKVLMAQGKLVLPRTPIEMEMSAIWREVLAVEVIGVHDNFFEAGGHSLLATQVISRVHDVFRVDLPLRSLFEAPTIAGLSERVATVLPREQGAQANPIVPVSRDQELPLAFSQERMWLVHQLQPESSAYNIPVAIRLQGLLERQGHGGCPGRVGRTPRDPAHDDRYSRRQTGPTHRAET